MSKIHLVQSPRGSYCGALGDYYIQTDSGLRHITLADFPNKTYNPDKVTCLSCIKSAGLFQRVRWYNKKSGQTYKYGRIEGEGVSVKTSKPAQPQIVPKELIEEF